MPSSIDKRRMRDGKEGLLASKELPDDYEQLLVLEQRVHDSIRALQSLDNLGPELNKEMFDAEDELQKRLKLIEKKKKELTPSLSERLKRFVKKPFKEIKENVSDYFELMHMDDDRFEITNDMLEWIAKGPPKWLQFGTEDKWGYESLNKKELVAWLESLDDEWMLNRIISDEFSEDLGDSF